MSYFEISFPNKKQTLHTIYKWLNKYPCIKCYILKTNIAYNGSNTCTESSLAIVQLFKMTGSGNSQQHNWKMTEWAIADCQWNHI